MPKEIKAEDLVAKDIFKNTIESATKLLEATKQVKVEFAEVLKISQEQAKINPLANFKDFQNLDVEMKKATVVFAEMEKLQKEEVKLTQQINQLRGEEGKRIALLKVAKENLNKETKIEAKLVSTSTSEYEKSRIKLKQLTSELLNLKPGSEQFKKVAFEAGKLKDQINDAKDAVKAFANESKTATAKNLFGQVFRDIADLDFKGAADKAKILAEVVHSISLSEVVGGVKNLGSALLDLGKAAILNPLTAIAVAIGAVGLGLYELYRSYKFADNAAEEFNKTLGKQDEALRKVQKETENLRIQNDLLAGKITEKQAKTLKAEKDFTEKYIAILKEQRERAAEVNKKFDLERSGAILAARAGGGSTRDLAGLEKERNRELAIIEKQKNEQLKAQQKLFQEELRGIRLEGDKKEKQDNKKASTEKLIIKKKEDTAIVVQAKDNSKELEDIEKKKWEDALAAADQYYKEANDEGERELKRIRKRRKEETDMINAVLDGSIKAINKKREAEIKAADAAIKKTEDAVSYQEQRAAQGLDNTLAYEKQKLAEAELAKRQLEEEQEKRLKRQAFYKAFAAILETAKEPSDITTAASKALLQVVLADTIAGAFKDGVEGFNGKGTGTSDSNLVRISDNESVVTAKGTTETPGLVTAVNKKGLDGAEEWFHNNMSPVLRENNISSSESATLNELREIKRELKNKKELNVDWDSHDRRTETLIENGYKKVIHYINSKPRI